MFPEGRERTRAIGLYTAVSIGGGAVGLIAGGMLTEWASWRWVLFVNVPIGIAVLVIGAAVLPETAAATRPVRPRRRVDLDARHGRARVRVRARREQRLVRSAETIGAFVVGVALLAAFVRHRDAGRLARSRRCACSPTATAPASYVARLLLVAGMIGMFFFLTQFLQDVLGYSALITGFAFLPITVAVFASSQLSARVLVDRFGGAGPDDRRHRLSTVGSAWSPSSPAARVTADPHQPAALRCRQRARVRAADLGRARRCGPAGRRRRVRSGNVMQQVGGALGLAVLVTVFGSASKYAASHPVSGANPLAQLNHVFVYGADHAFVASTLFLVAALVLIATVVRAPKPTPTLAE